MKIKLIQVPGIFMEDNSYLVPSGIATIKNILGRKGFNVDQDDLNIKIFRHNQNMKDSNKKIDLNLFCKDEFFNEYMNSQGSILEKELEKIISMTNIKGYDVIALSITGNMYFFLFKVALVLSKIIKEKTGAIIILGGVSHKELIVKYEDYLSKNYIDFVILGQGIKEIINLLDALSNNYLGKVIIPNVFTSNKKYLSENGRHLHFDFDYGEDFKPNYDGLPLDLYRFYPTNKKSKKNSVLVLPYFFIKSCRNNCIFCATSGTNFESRPLPVVANDISIMSKKYKTRYFYFLNSNINPSIRYVNNLYNSFNNNKIDVLWTDCANFKFMNNEVLKKLNGIGAIRLVYGLESASNKMLKYVQKGIDVKKAETIIKKSHEQGIWNEIDLISGLPYENNRDIKNTIEFINRNRDYIDFIYLNRFMLKDDSLLFKYPKKYGLTNLENLQGEYHFMGLTSKQNEDIECHIKTRFDEINGLNWPKKIKQINGSFDTINNSINEYMGYKNTGYNPFIKLPLLFYLYSEYDNKQEIQDYFKNIKNVLVNPNQNITNNISKNSSEEFHISKIKKDKRKLSKVYELTIINDTTKDKGFNVDLKDNSKINEEKNELININRIDIIYQVYKEKKQYDKAIKYLKENLKKYPNSPLLLRNLGECYMEKGEYKKALTNLKKALKFKPDLEWLNFSLGKIFFLMKDYKDAEKYLKRNIKIKNQEFLSYFYACQFLIKLYLLENKEKDVLGYFDKIHSFLDKNSFDIDNKNKLKIELINEISHYYMNKKEYDKSINYLKENLKKYPNSPLLLRNLGECYMEKGEYKKALTNLKKALKFKPDLEWLNFSLGKIFFLMKDYKNAEKYLKKNLKIKNQSSMSYISSEQLLDDIHSSKVLVNETKS
jgi:radical SAM superfamily enzyme YgiQ (UPF0313 family)/Tfp pilus assembly protein PilF